MKQTITCAIAMTAALSLGGVALAQQAGAGWAARKGRADTGFVK